MSRRKSNKNLTFSKDGEKSYVYVEERGTMVGMLYWHYGKKKWAYHSHQKVKR